MLEHELDEPEAVSSAPTPIVVIGEHELVLSSDVDSSSGPSAAAEDERFEKLTYYVGFEYECADGHRHISRVCLTAVTKLAESGDTFVGAASDVPLDCPCRSCMEAEPEQQPMTENAEPITNRLKCAARLQRLFIVTADHPFQLVRCATPSRDGT